MQGKVRKLGLGDQIPRVFYDSQKVIHLSKNSAFHERIKHIDVHVHFVRGIISKGQIKVEIISTKINPADMLTKSIPISKFEEVLELLNVLSTWLWKTCRGLMRGQYFLNLNELYPHF